MSLDERLAQIEQRAEKISYLLSREEVFTDGDRLASLLKEQKQLERPLELHRRLLAIDEELTTLSEEAAAAAREGDRELQEYISEEISALRSEREEKSAQLRPLLLPRDPDDDKSVVVEIRAGTGGEEAALFAADLCRMYAMYAARAGLRFTLTYSSQTELGGYKEVSFLLEGDGAFGRMKYEAGVHRVQRVPRTESQGRIQTSAVTVAVLPEAEEVEVNIAPGDIEIETCKSSGAGGQHINKTESAVRVIHRPSGIVVECRSERSQLQNKDQALKILRSKLYERERAAKEEQIAGARRAQVGSGDRSEKIRTYNYPQNRVTDHRIGLTLHTLDRFLDGEIEQMLDALAAADAAAKMREQGAEL